MLTIDWRRGRRRFSASDGFAGVGLIAVATSLLWPHLPALQRLWPPCHFRALTGFPCGTCGFTRAFVRMASLDFGAAFTVSPLGAATFALWALFSLWVLASRLSPKVALPSPRVGGWVGRFGIVAIFGANWAYLLLYTWLRGAPPP